MAGTRIRTDRECQNTRKITKAMQMVAVSNASRKTAAAARPYAVRSWRDRNRSINPAPKPYARRQAKNAASLIAPTAVSSAAHANVKPRCSSSRSAGQGRGSGDVMGSKGTTASASEPAIRQCPQVPDSACERPDRAGDARPFAKGDRPSVLVHRIVNTTCRPRARCHPPTRAAAAWATLRARPPTSVPLLMRYINAGVRARENALPRWRGWSR